MSKLSDLFGRKAWESAAEKPTNDDAAALNPETLSEVGSRLGEENEALRNLLFDTGRKIGELDELKSAFEKIVVPFNVTLRALEEEKSQNINLKAMLAESRSSYETLRTDYYQIDRKATLHEADAERLREDIELSREAGRALEAARSELSSQIQTQSTQLADLERQFSLESAERLALSENKRILLEQLEVAEKRVLELEGQYAATREKLALIEDEKRSLQGSMDQALNETARLTRRLSESEGNLTAARGQLGKVEAAFAEVYGERGRLAAALDESREQHQAERNSMAMRLDGLQSRTNAAEKLLAEARQNLIARTEEVRGFDRKAVEATIARNNADKRLAQIEALAESRERQTREIEQSRNALVERANALTKSLKTRENALARAEEKIQGLTERTGHLEADIQVSRTNIEKRVEDLNTALQRERMERAVVEGALEAARKDNSRLQNELSTLRSTMRRGTPVNAATTAEEAPRGKKSRRDESVEPIIKS